VGAWYASTLNVQGGLPPHTVSIAYAILLRFTWFRCDGTFHDDEVILTVMGYLGQDEAKSGRKNNLTVEV
jgi:hypothetical protein